MKILWFEVTEPSAYASNKEPIGAWQDSLERIVKTEPTIELTVVFVSSKYTDERVVDGVRYIPIYTKWSFIERVFSKHWDVFVKKMIPKANMIIDVIKPDLIHIFGTEWPFGQIAAFTKIPIVIHIMGAVVPYNNANYPPNYSFVERLCKQGRNPKSLYFMLKNEKDLINWEVLERRTWALVENYMGRTQWDCSLSRVMHPGRRYFHVEEAIRPVFLTGELQWKRGLKGKRVHLISTGCGIFRKGPDMMLKVAHILTELKIDFEWNVAGMIDVSFMREIERHEGFRFKDNNVCFLGQKQPNELCDILCSSTVYIHTAYMENSPNSICEAQCIGLPIISTNVGGISSLVHHNVDGILVPANDPWQMADAIIQLVNDEERLMLFSERGRAVALKRHNEENIKQQLLYCYNELLNLKD